MNEIKFEKMALYKNKEFLMKNVGVSDFKKGVIELIPGIENLLQENYKYIYNITFDIYYNYYENDICFVCTNYDSFFVNGEDITFKRKNGTYKTKINFEPFIKWYKYKFIPELNEYLQNKLKDKKYKYSPYLEHHIYQVLTKNRIDYINKIIYD